MLNRLLIILLILIGTNSIKAQVPVEFARQDSSTYRIIDEGENKLFSIIEISIKSKEGPVMRGNISILNADKKRILLFSSDKDGQAYLILFESKDLQSIIIDDIGYSSIVIPISKIKNRNSKIEVYLQGQSTSD